MWEWTLEADAPVCYIALGEDYSLQTFIMFHPNDPHQLISNSEDMVVFYYWVWELSYKKRTCSLYLCIEIGTCIVAAIAILLMMFAFQFCRKGMISKWILIPYLIRYHYTGQCVSVMCR